MQIEGDDTPDYKVVLFFDQARGINMVLGYQLDDTATSVQTLDGEFIVQQSQDDVVVLGRHAAVDHQGVALIDARPRHRVTLHPKEIGGVFVADELFVEIHPLLGVVGCRRRKACGDFPRANV